MPQFIQLRLPNDHTAGTTPGNANARRLRLPITTWRWDERWRPFPTALIWDDTAFFILEDDAQNGADHVDAHRSVALVVSKYSPRAAQSDGRQHFLHHGKCGADHGRVVRFAADEQQRRLCPAHRFAVRGRW